MARVLIHVLFAATVLGGLGLFGSALAADAMGARLLGIALYGAAPGVAAWLLSRRAWSGGTGLWLGLIATQVWLAIGALGNIGDGSARGFTQLFLPLLVLWFLTRKESRAWFRLAERDREDKPPFSLPHVITWRRDRGQANLEYVGLIILVAAIIIGLVATGVSTDIAAKMSQQVCRVVSDGDCGDSGDGTRTEAGERPDAKAHGSGGQGGTGDTGGTDSGDTNDTGGDGSSSGSGGTTQDPQDPGDGPDGPDGTKDRDSYPETNPEPEAAYDVPVSDADKPDDGGDGDNGGDGGGDKNDCDGFWGCSWDKISQVGKGLGVDGVWGDLEGIGALFDPDTWSGMADYGEQLGSQWVEDSKDAGSKWDKGDYLGAIGDWGGASLNTGVKVLDDMFVGDEVRERWNNGQKTRAVTDVVWNVGSLFIPGYDVAKVVGKVGKLGKLGKVAEKIAEAADKAGDAAKRARKAAEVGDVGEARKAAKEADEAADAAEDQARRTGCVIALGPSRRTPTTPGLIGGTGSGTVVLAAGGPSRVILADDGCDKEAEAKAKEARKQEREAYLAKKRAEEPQRAKDAAKKMKKWDDPKRNDTSDPRNYLDPDWAKNLKDPKLGDADKFDGFWASRDRNPPPNWKNESWLRYQEQVTGVKRGKEYVVPHSKEGVPDVEFDGWDSGRQTFLEAKNGYKTFLGKDGNLTKSGKETFVKEAKRQVDAAGGRPIEWHFSDPDVAKAARRAFREENLKIKVVHTKQKPTGGPRNPSQFD
ncbi:restriction endonuclease fold toxin 5 domain-containing protein [Streptomyces sp. RY43-2]|uniref:Restriction endonuclease fold toxin 5 domain-containing protein n=2 Tax=Streptomyces macrolidinus TaxID=2952607 RepID=A0ABT0ZLK5_9ACTN|nr:Tox-REase-5 domain-containing protein [Streptomyces macrolidinus]MCN9244451.1 restriction endonuclease fold toxin 5 domain-containing protein [Streptomyces macrolidinus]